MQVDLLLNMLASSSSGVFARRPLFDHRPEQSANSDLWSLGSSNSSTPPSPPPPSPSPVCPWSFSDEPQGRPLIHKWIASVAEDYRLNFPPPQPQAPLPPPSRNIPIPVNPTQRVKQANRPVFRPKIECGLCKKNGEPKEVYSTHILKDRADVVVCPILRRLPCPICLYPGGDRSHTRRFCPLNPDPEARKNKPIVRVMKEKMNSTGKFPRRSD